MRTLAAGRMNNTLFEFVAFIPANASEGGTSRKGTALSDGVQGFQAVSTQVAVRISKYTRQHRIIPYKTQYNPEVSINTNVGAWAG